MVYTEVVMKRHGIAIESWDGVRRHDALNWLEQNYGLEGIRWGTEHDFDLENLWMNEDVYIWYLLKWGS